MFEDENSIRFLVASDIHLGYKERELIGKDAYVTFDEIFQIAKDKQVDFVLLGGDLFHQSAPSKKCLHFAMETMRKYCLGNRKCDVKVVSDQASNFGHTTKSIKTVNYEDPRLNISMPVFSIHGNHDDPTGESELSAIDLLSVAGFLNHFGKTNSAEKIAIKPVLLEKGTTKLALYGLGAIREEWLHRFYKNNQMQLEGKNKNDWFNVMVIHQNRSHRGKYNYKPEDKLDKCLDLVIWGHEHESKPKPERSFNGFDIIQTGSVVVTQMTKAECKPKKISIVTICGKEKECQEISLKTPRQAYLEDLELSKYLPRDSNNKTIQEYVENRIETIIEDANKKRHLDQPKEPRILLKIDATDFPNFVTCRFYGKFTGKVANPRDLIKIKTHDSKSSANAGPIDANAKLTIEELVNKEEMDLKVLVSEDLTYAMKAFVYKNETKAMEKLCINQIGEQKRRLMKCSVEDLEKNIENEIKKLKRKRAISSTFDKNNEETTANQQAKKPHINEMDVKPTLYNYNPRVKLPSYQSLQPQQNEVIIISSDQPPKPQQSDVVVISSDDDENKDTKLM